MAQTLYAPLNGVSDEVKKILVSTGGLSDYVIKGYCSVGGLSKLFFGNSQPQPTGKVIFENGEFTNITSPSCQRKTITYAGDENTPSAQSNSVIINKDIGWLREYSQTASYPWTITDTQIVSGNISNITGISDDSENILAIPVLGSIIENSGSGSAIAAKIRITLKATGSNGPFVIGTNYTMYNGTYYYYPMSQTQRALFSSNPSSTQYPLNQIVTVDLDLSNDRLNYLKNHLHDGYWWVCIGSPPNYGYTPKVYIDKIEYLDYELSPEYDYEAGKTYTIHNSLTMVETLDEAFNKFDAEMIRRNIYSSPSSYPGPNYLKNNWNTIRTAIINKFGTVSATCIFVRINTASSDKEVSFNIYFGGDSFPRQVTIQQVSTGTLDTKYCLFTSGTYLNTTYFMSASVKQNNTYTVSDPTSYSNFLSGMGCWSNYVGTSSQGACSSYGMKMD